MTNIDLSRLDRALQSALPQHVEGNMEKTQHVAQFAGLNVPVVDTALASFCGVYREIRPWISMLLKVGAWWPGFPTAQAKAWFQVADEELIPMVCGPAQATDATGAQGQAPRTQPGQSSQATASAAAANKGR